MSERTKKASASGELVLTTAELPWDLYRRAKIAAVDRRVTFRSLMVEGLEYVVAQRKSSTVARPVDADLAETKT